VLAVLPLVSRSKIFFRTFLPESFCCCRSHFQLGDLISVTGIEGNVDDIQARATVIATKEGRRVVIPNAILFTSPVAVEAATAKQR